MFLKLMGAAKLFYQGCQELYKDDLTWQEFKKVLKKVQRRPYGPVPFCKVANGQTREKRRPSGVCR
jgi:hypothetical protein